MTLPPSLKDRVLSAARQQPSLPRRRGLPAWLPAALAALGMAVVFAVAGGTRHSAGRPTDVSEWVVVGFAALALTVTWLVLPPRRSMLSPATSRLVAVAVGVPVVVGAWLMGWHAAYADPFSRFGLRCFALTLALAPWPFAALALAAPRTLPDRPWILGAALGSAAGAWAAVVVELWCPLADPAHVTLGHVAPLVALIGLGALLGPRLLRARAGGSARARARP